MTNIEEDFGKVVAAMRDASSKTPEAPYYMFGHRLEISNRLLEMGDDKTLKYKKYPLVALRLDIGEENRGGLVHMKLNVAILALTDMNYNADQRLQKVFKPVLFPLYDLLLKKLQTSGIFYWKSYGIPEHTKLNRYFWGTDGGEGNKKAIFNDPLDAIELIDLKLTQKIKC